VKVESKSASGARALARRREVLAALADRAAGHSAEHGVILLHENDGSAFIGGGFSFGFGTGTTGWDMGILPTQIRTINNVVIATVDNTQFHDYRIQWSPGPSLAFYLDNVLISTNNGGFSGSVNQVFFGDGTGAANARAEITFFRFRQGAAITPTTGTSWSRIKALYR